MSSLSLVTDAFVAKPEAIELLEIALNTTADRRKPADVYLYTPHGTMLTIEVPKYGEDLPLTLDLSADVPEHELERQAGELTALLKDTLGWSCHILGKVDQ